MTACQCPPYEGTDQYVFVSYCRKEAAMVYPILDRMGRAGYRLWYDSGIQTGSEWPEVIATHLQKSAAVMLFLTTDSVRSHNCRNEVNYAVEMGKPLVPVIVEGTSLTPGMKMTLGAFQWLKVYNPPTECNVREILECAVIKGCKGLLDNRIPETPLWTGKVKQVEKPHPEFDLGIVLETMREKQTESDSESTPASTNLVSPSGDTAADPVVPTGAEDLTAVEGSKPEKPSAAEESELEKQPAENEASMLLDQWKSTQNASPVMNQEEEKPIPPSPTQGSNEVLPIQEPYPEQKMGASQEQADAQNHSISSKYSEIDETMMARGKEQKTDPCVKKTHPSQAPTGKHSAPKHVEEHNTVLKMAPTEQMKQEAGSSPTGSTRRRGRRGDKWRNSLEQTVDDGVYSTPRESNLDKTISTNLDKTVVENKEVDLDKTVVAPKETVPVIVFPAAGKRFRGKKGETTLGRNKPSDVVIPDPEKRISKQHCSLVSVGNTHVVLDLEAPNGTFVNGERLESGARMNVPEIIELGLYKTRLLVGFGSGAEKLEKCRTLLALESEETGEIRYLLTGEMELGRSNIWKTGAMSSQSISHLHATINLKEEGATITDHSRNGTWLNNEKLVKGEEKRLNSGDRLRMGNEYFVVHITPIKEDTGK